MGRDGQHEAGQHRKGTTRRPRRVPSEYSKGTLNPKPTPVAKLLSLVFKNREK